MSLLLTNKCEWFWNLKYCRRYIQWNLSNRKWFYLHLTHIKIPWIAKQKYLFYHCKQGTKSIRLIYTQSDFRSLLSRCIFTFRPSFFYSKFDSFINLTWFIWIHLSSQKNFTSFVIIHDNTFVHKKMSWCEITWHVSWMKMTLTWPERKKRKKDAKYGTGDVHWIL